MTIRKFNYLSIAIVSLFILMLCSSFSFKESKNLDTDYFVGNWKTDSTKITIRYKEKWLKYHFVSCNVTASLSIQNNNLVKGFIGNANFSNGILKKNKGNPEFNGISYIINCGQLGSIFKNDTSALKTIELWVKPMKDRGQFTAEIRLKDGWDTFPMGEFVFIKVK